MEILNISLCINKGFFSNREHKGRANRFYSVQQRCHYLHRAHSLRMNTLCLAGFVGWQIAWWVLFDAHRGLAWWMGPGAGRRLWLMSGGGSTHGPKDYLINVLHSELGILYTALCLLALTPFVVLALLYPSQRRKCGFALHQAFAGSISKENAKSQWGNIKNAAWKKARLRRRKERRGRRRMCNREFWGKIKAKMEEGKGGKKVMKQGTLRWVPKMTIGSQ